MKRRLPMTYVSGLILLLILSKLSISGFFLGSGSDHTMVLTSALADEKASTPGEKNLAGELRKKETEIKAREERVKKQEAELLSLKEEIETRMASLTDLQARLTAHAKELADREKALSDSKMDHLVALYSSMEPAKAAAILDKLKLDIVVSILKHMKGKSAGAILAMMDPAKGALISEELSRAQ